MSGSYSGPWGVSLDVAAQPEALGVQWGALIRAGYQRHVTKSHPGA